MLGKSTVVLVFALIAVLQLSLSSEVVELTVDNFEKLTQASTGATTGDWLVKFYAPWCGHCKTLAPTWEEVANDLKGVVNVAKVDVMSNRALGTRFGIEGFPSLKLLSKGQVYDFRGRRSREEIVEFARGGYQISEPVTVPGEMGIFGEVSHIYMHAYRQASKDLRRGNYFTADVFLAIMPALFVFIFLLICLIPAPDAGQITEPTSTAIPNAARASRSVASGPSAAAPATASQDTDKKTD